MLLVFVVLQQQNLWAAATSNYHYHARVNGMVCAFCAYSVSKNISKLPGVDADTVNVDLKGGQVEFESTQPVSEKKLAALFSESGFRISHLSLTKNSVAKVKPATRPAIELDLAVDQVKPFSAVIDTLGNTLADTAYTLIITAPPEQEEVILKPLLMGRQQVIKVQFKSAASDRIHLQVFNSADRHTTD